jgi:hypothetical protein
MQITMEGKYQTRDGRAVRILATDLPNAGSYPVIGWVPKLGLPSIEYAQRWTSDGLSEFHEMSGPFGTDSLIPVPTKHEGWMFVSLDGRPVGNIYPTEKEAQDWATTTWKWVCGFIFLAHMVWEE